MGYRPRVCLCVVIVVSEGTSRPVRKVVTRAGRLTRVRSVTCSGGARWREWSGVVVVRVGRVSVHGSSDRGDVGFEARVSPQRLEADESVDHCGWVVV